MNKETELFYLVKFKENFPSFPLGEICPDECPDFLIKSTSGIVGIEVTDFYRQRSPDTPNPLQQRESVRRKIITAAKSAYDEKGLSPVYVTVHFDLNFNCRRADIRPIVERLAELAENALPGLVKERILRAYEIQLDGVSLLTVKKIRLPKSYWSAPLASFVPSVRPAQIQGILDEKSARCKDYRKKCDAIWLLIIMDRFKASSFSMITNEVVERQYVHAFDLAFLFLCDRDDMQKPPMLLRNG